MCCYGCSVSKFKQKESINNDAFFNFLNRIIELHALVFLVTDEVQRTLDPGQ